MRGREMHERNVTVPKDRLLDTLRINRDQHATDYVEAMHTYREKALDALVDRVELVREGGEFDLRFNLPQPISYLDSYDTAIAMFEWEIADTIELSQEDFRRYVLNEWEWESMFVANTRSYLG